MDQADPLESYLRDLADKAEPGHQLPTVRQLMAQFGVSQAKVQRAIAILRDCNLVRAEIGRGTYVIHSAAGAVKSGPEPVAAAAGARSVLILRRSISTRRGQAVIEGLQGRLTKDGHSVVEVAYSDMQSADRILAGLPQFDACVMHSSFDSIPIETLAAIQRKAKAIVVDGAALTGVEVDAVGIEWGEGVQRALDLLRQRGHRAVGLVVTGHYLLAVEMGKRRFLEQTDATSPRPILTIPVWPYQDYEAQAIQQILANRQNNDRFPYTALIVWGVEDGANFRQLLTAHGIDVPGSLSIVCLGRTDLDSEHDRFFTTIGIRVEDQVTGLYEAIARRWAQPDSEYTTRFLPTVIREGGSVGNLAVSAGVKRKSG